MKTRYPADRLPVGVIGLGRIGSRIASRMSGLTTPLFVHDKDSAKKALGTDIGGIFVEDAAELGRRAATIILSLPDADSVFDAVAGPCGVLKTGCGRKVTHIIDLSTIPVKAGVTLAEECSRGGIVYLDAPISGGIWRAASGRLTVMVGGAASEVKRVRPILRMFARNVIHLGPTGSGLKAKLLHNMVGEIQVHAWAEAIAVATRLGLEPVVFLKAMSTGMASSAVLTLLYGTVLREGRQSVSVPLHTAAKDQQCLRELADSAGLELETPKGVWSRLEWLREEGLGARDVTSILSYFEQRHGVLVVTP